MTMPQLGDGYNDDKSFYDIYKYVVDLESIIEDLLYGIPKHDYKYSFGLDDDRINDIHEVYQRIQQSRKK